MMPLGVRCRAQPPRCRPSPGPPPGPVPPKPPAGGFLLQQGTACLTLAGIGSHPDVILGGCDGGSKWEVGEKSHLTNLGQPSGQGFLKVLLMPLADPGPGPACAAGGALTAAEDRGSSFSFVNGTLQLTNSCSHEMCVSAVAKGRASLQTCGSVGTTGWTKA